MSKGNSRRAARDHKYTEMTVSHPKDMIGIHGWRRDVYPDPKPPRHGHAPEKPEREDPWQ